jgi:Heterokaryon incompatibility protein (HET)
MNQIYFPLNKSRLSIRLLELYAGTDEAEIECKLQAASLEDNPHYEALSYTWGESTKDRAIKIAGCLVSTQDNLYSALFHLRYPDRARVIWADALCINQNDVGEKKKQVQIMGRIYTQCTQCLIWLGDIPKSIDEDTSFSLNDAQTVFDLLRLLACKEPGETLLASLSHSSQRTRAAYAITGMMFWGNKWWRRIWTVQVGLADKVHRLRESTLLIQLLGSRPGLTKNARLGDAFNILGDVPASFQKSNRAISST